MDRITGQSKYNDRERPPAPCCWVPPCVAWFPELLETNSCCKIFGGMGISTEESFRMLCLHMGFVANIGAMILTAYTCLSISLQYFLLSMASMEILEYTEMVQYPNVGQESPETVTIYTGLQGVAMNNPSLATSPTGQQIVIGYDDFCAFSNDGLERYLDPTKDCSSCASTFFSMNAVLSILISVATFFPTFFSQQLRMYSGYDINCVKNFLTILGLVTIFLNLNVMLTYFYLCSKESFYRDGTIFFNEEGIASSVAPADGFYWRVEYQWKWGWGLIFLVAGTALKLIDLLCNLAVPTPSVTRDRKEQDIYETIVFASPADDTDDDEINQNDADPI